MYAKCFEVGERRFYVVRGKPWHYQRDGVWHEADPQWMESNGDWAWKLEGCGYQAWMAARLRDVPFLRVVDANGREVLYRLGDPQWRTPAGVQVIGSLPNLPVGRGRWKHELVAGGFLHARAVLNLVGDTHRVGLLVDLPDEARRALPPCTLERYGQEPELVVPLVQINNALTAQQTYYGETADGHIYGYSTVYSNARATSTSCDSSAIGARLGQNYDGSGYTVYRAYVSFDTSVIPDDVSVTSAKLYLCASLDMSSTDFDITVYRYNWSESLCDSREANYDGAYGGSATLEGTLRKTSAGWSPGTYYNMDVSPARINVSGDTKYSVVSSRDVSANTPTGYEYVDFYTADQAGTTQDPYLVIEIAAGFALFF
jgi:hypothetical protein